MSRVFCLRYALLTSLLVAFLGIAGSPIVCSDRASAAEEKKLVKANKHVKHERKEYLKLKATKERRRPRGDDFKPFWCFDPDDC